MSLFMHRAGLMCAGPPPPPANAWIGATLDNTAQTTYTFSSVSLGTPHALRYIVVGIAPEGSLLRTISSATIGGVAATIVSNSSQAIFPKMIIAAVPAGATGNIAITFSAGLIRCTIGVWAAYDITSVTPHASIASSSGTGSINLGINVQAAKTIYSVVNTFDLAETFTGLTSRAAVDAPGGLDVEFADYLASGAETPHAATYSDAINNARGIAASF